MLTRTAFIGSNGRFVKAGTEGAKRVQIRINRTALSRAGKRTARRQRVLRNRRERGGKKAGLSRKIGRSGGRFLREHRLKVSGFLKREYEIPDLFSDDLVLDIFRRERLEFSRRTILVEGVVEFSDGNFQGTKFFLVRVFKKTVRALLQQMLDIVNDTSPRIDDDAVATRFFLRFSFSDN